MWWSCRKGRKWWFVVSFRPLNDWLFVPMKSHKKTQLPPFFFFSLPFFCFLPAFRPCQGFATAMASGGVIKEGWLFREEMVEGSISTWKKRWNVLTLQKLQCFKHNNVSPLSCPQPPREPPPSPAPLFSRAPARACSAAAPPATDADAFAHAGDRTDQ